MESTKNNFLFVLVFLCAFLGNAQEIKSKKRENYLPEAGDWAISFNANGVFKYIGNTFNGNLDNKEPSLSSPEGNAFVGKKFITDKSAYRVVFELGYNSISQPITDIADNELTDIKQTLVDVTLGFGKEWRKGKTRLQGFYGADATISMESGLITTNTKNATTNAFIESEEYKVSPGFGIGVQGFIGAEYFIFPKFSLGVQYTYRVRYSKSGDIKYTINEVDEIPQSYNLGKSSIYNIGILGISSINLTLHF